MRVLFLFPGILDPNISQGGVAEFLFALPPALKKIGVESIVYTRDKKAKTITGPVSVADNVVVYKGPWIKPAFFYSRKTLQHIVDLCEALKIDVIHAEGTYTAGFLALKIHEETGIPYVATSHSDILEVNSRRMKRKQVQKRCQAVLKFAAGVTHLTPTMEQASHNLFCTRDKSTLIPNGIACNNWHAFSKLPERNFLLSIGRLERGKGFHILIDMFAELLHDSTIKTSLVIAGTGTTSEALKHQARKLKLNVCDFDFKTQENFPERSVIFTGYIRGELKKQLISECQAVLFATQPALWEEAFGIVLLETMAAGKPLISSDINSARFLETRGLKALFVEPENVSAWVQAVKLLLADQKLRYIMGKDNWFAAQDFDWEVIAKQYQSVFMDAIA